MPGQRLLRPLPGRDGDVRPGAGRPVIAVERASVWPRAALIGLLGNTALIGLLAGGVVSGKLKIADDVAAVDTNAKTDPSSSTAPVASAAVAPAATAPVASAAIAPTNTSVITHSINGARTLPELLESAAELERMTGVADSDNAALLRLIGDNTLRVGKEDAIAKVSSFTRTIEGLDGISDVASLHSAVLNVRRAIDGLTPERGADAFISQEEKGQTILQFDNELNEIKTERIANFRRRLAVADSSELLLIKEEIAILLSTLGSYFNTAELAHDIQAAEDRALAEATYGQFVTRINGISKATNPNWGTDLDAILIEATTLASTNEAFRNRYLVDVVNAVTNRRNFVRTS